MKKLLFLSSVMLMTWGAVAAEIQPLAGAPLDYSDRANWMLLGSTPVKYAVDLFYLYPTCVPADCKTDIGEVDAAMKHAAMCSYLKGSSCMEAFTNVYAPYYRQISGVGIMKAKKTDDLEQMCRQAVVRTDVYAALDYYFEHQNQGRPFILASHSQGSCNLKIVLSEYMKAHPEYLKRMVACYAIGYCFPESWFQSNPHVKKATGALDTGVLISWNSETPGGAKYNLCIGDGSFVINPLNWKTDETPAAIAQNLGSAEVDENTLKKTLVSGKVCAKIDLKRGVLVCEGNVRPIRPNPIFGDNSLHFDDWALFYENIRENAQQRIKAYLRQ